jgi:hypothetical protein
MGMEDPERVETRSPFTPPLAPPPNTTVVPPGTVPRRAATPPRQPGALSRVNWSDLRVKGWAAALTLATAYVATKPEKYGWLAPVLTAWAAASKPPVQRQPEDPKP